MAELLAARHKVAIPEIADYEVRRELIRADKRIGLDRLDTLKLELRYLKLDTETMLKAAEFWAECRKAGRPTAADHALDADVILAAQAWCARSEGVEIVVATTNPKHLSHMVPAQYWTAIKPN